MLPSPFSERSFSAAWTRLSRRCDVNSNENSEILRKQCPCCLSAHHQLTTCCASCERWHRVVEIGTAALVLAAGMGLTLAITAVLHAAR